MGQNFSDNLNSFGKRLAYARNNKGLTQKQVADFLKKSKSQIISAWENDKNEPTLKEIRIIAHLLGTTVSFLVDEQSGSAGPTGDSLTLAQQQEKINQLQEQVIQLQKEKIALQNQQLERLKNIEGVPDKP